MLLILYPTSDLIGSWLVTVGMALTGVVLLRDGPHVSTWNFNPGKPEGKHPAKATGSDAKTRKESVVDLGFALDLRRFLARKKQTKGRKKLGEAMDSEVFIPRLT
jgi:hypothetical protein